MKKHFFLVAILMVIFINLSGQVYRTAIPTLKAFNADWNYYLFDESGTSTCTNGIFYFESYYNPSESNSNFVSFDGFELMDDPSEIGNDKYVAMSGIVDQSDQSRHSVEQLFPSFNWSGFTSPKTFYIEVDYTTATKISNTYSIAPPWSNIMIIARTFYPKPKVGSIIIASNQSSNVQVEYNTSPGQLSGIAATGGNGTFSYQWQQKPSGGTYTNITGANSAGYTPNPLSATTLFRRMDTPNICGAALYTNELTINVLPNVSGGTIGTSQTVCYSTNVTFLNIASGSGGTGVYSYQWQSSLDNVNFQDIPGANSLTNTVNNLTVTTYFRRKCTSGVNFTNSNTITITVLPNLTFGSISPSQTICYGATPAQITGTTPTGGDGNYSYKWQSSTDGNNWSDVSLAIGINYQPSTLTVSTYFHRITTSGSGCGSGASSPVTISVYGNLISGTISPSQTICYGSTPSQLIGTNPTGGDGTYSYKWQLSTDGTNWSDIALASAATYQPSSLSVTTYYHRVVTSGSSCGTVTSSPVTITVFNNLTSGTIASSQTICYGATPNLLSGTTPSGGDGTYIYKWQLSTDGTTWSDIALATTTNYQPSALTITTYFHRIATSGSSCGSITSSPVTINVYGNLTSGNIAPSQTICYGATPSLLCGTSPTGGDGTYSYKWQLSADGNIWTDISSATGLNYQPGTLTITTYYHRLVTTGSNCGSIISSPVTVTVYDSLTPGTISPSQTICNGATPSQILGTNPTGGDGHYSYIWQLSTDGITWSEVPMENNSSYQPVALTVTTNIQRVVTSGSGCGSKPSSIITITVHNSLDPGNILKTQTICYGSTPQKIDGTTAIGANGIFNYQWKYSLDGNSYSDLPGETGLSFQPGALTQTAYYERIVNTNCGVGISPVVPIVVFSDLNAGSITSSQTICYNSIPTIITGTFPSGGDGNYTFNWQSSLDASNWSDSLSAGRNYQPGALVSTTSYRRVVTSGSGCGSRTSSPVTITVYANLNPGIIYSPQSVCYSSVPDGLTGTSASGGDGSYSYQWRYSENGSTWNDVPGALNYTYQPASLMQTTYYKRFVTNSCGSGLTDSIKIEVKNPIDPGIISSSQTICYNSVPQMLTGSDATGGFDSYSYQWQLSYDNATYTDIATKTDKNYLPGTLISNCYFRRIATDSICGSIYTKPLLINVMTALPTPNLYFNSIYCQGSDIMLSAGSDFTYYWYDANQNLIQTGSDYSVKNIQNNQLVYVKAQNNQNCFSDPEQINLNVDKVKADFTTDRDSFAIGEQVKFINTSTGASNYVWKLENYTYTDQDIYFNYYNTGEKTVQLTATSSNNCQNTFLNKLAVEIYDNSISSTIDNSSDPTILIYPTVVKDFLHVESSQVIKELELINAIGVQVNKFAVNANEFHGQLSGIKPGLLIVKVTFKNNRVHISKIVKL